jgi:Glycine transporter
MYEFIRLFCGIAISKFNAASICSQAITDATKSPGGLGVVQGAMIRTGRAVSRCASLLTSPPAFHLKSPEPWIRLCRSQSLSSGTPTPQTQVTPPPGRSATAKPHEDGMARWPGLRTARHQLRAMDYIGTLSFASSGAIAAATAQMDLLGALFVGTVTAVGGGTIRDAVVLSKRPFWTDETEYLYMSLAAAGATFALWPRGEDKKPYEHEILNWIDALGVGAFAVIGAQNAIRAQMPVGVTVRPCVTSKRVRIAVHD